MTRSWDPVPCRRPLLKCCTPAWGWTSRWDGRMGMLSGVPSTKINSWQLTNQPFVHFLQNTQCILSVHLQYDPIAASWIVTQPG